MKLKGVYVLLTVVVLALATSENAYSQLLEDRNKLKTSKTKRKGFKPFKKNVKKPAKTNQKPKVVKAPPTRNTQDFAGKGQDRKVSPRYQQENAGNQGKFAIKPKFTQDWAGKGSDRKVAPRYQQENAGQQGKFKIAPRYTLEHAGSQGKKKIVPRYTQEHAGNQGKFDIQPRYTQDWAGKGSDRKVQPRYSTPPSYVKYPATGGKKGFLPGFQSGKRKPKYNQGPQYNFYGPSVTQVYTPSNSAAKYNKSINSYKKYKSRSRDRSPYASQTNYFGPKVPATYVPSNSMAKHNQSIESYQKYISKSPKNAPYTPQSHYTMVVKKRRKAKNAHPSANYLSAKYDGSRMMRNTKRKVSVTWVRTFGNKTQPKGVRKKVDKAKFDKDEKDIWNNKEREYTRN